MDTLLTLLEQPNLLSTVVRLALALVLGGILGLERGRKGRPAGLKTYMIVCMASALVMITGAYMLETYGVGDPSRMGAQVISGIGFLGAGTIIITTHQVKGLTTAAALWAAACMGLAVGAGFYSGAILCGLFLLLIMSVMSKVDHRLRLHSRQVNFFMEFESMEALGDFITTLQTQGYKLFDIKIDHRKTAETGPVGANLWIELASPADHVEVIHLLTRTQGVRYMEEFE